MGRENKSLLSLGKVMCWIIIPHHIIFNRNNEDGELILTFLFS